MKKSFYMMVFRLYQSHRNCLRPLMREISLSSGQPKILMYVREHANCRLKDVAANCDIKPATTSRIIDKLLEQGLLTRSLPKGDRRAMCLQISAAGEAALAKWHERCDVVEEQMLEGFSDAQRTQFYEYLTRAYENLNKGKGEREHA